LRLLDLPGVAAFDVALDQQAADRARRQARDADLVLQLIDSSEPEQPLDPAADLVIGTKIDLADPPASVDLAISATTSLGLTELRQTIVRRLRGRPNHLAMNQRHADCLRDAIHSLDAAADALSSGLGEELVARDLRDALDHLGRVSGVVTPDDLLSHVFSSFCIGK
jgi:tRNA modification GTPase